jgi:CheY-like chemotaxis protein
MLPNEETSMRILLAEDEPDLANWLARALERDGLLTDWVSDGRDVLPSLAARSYDALVLDLGLPGLDGHQVLAALRARRAAAGADPDRARLAARARGHAQPGRRRLSGQALRPGRAAGAPACPDPARAAAPTGTRAAARSPGTPPPRALPCTGSRWR